MCIWPYCSNARAEYGCFLLFATAGRKVTLAASVTDGADKVFADGEALFVQPRSSKL